MRLVFLERERERERGMTYMEDENMKKDTSMDFNVYRGM